MYFRGPDIGPEFVRTELVWVFCLRPSLQRQGRVLQQKETGAVRTNAEVAGWRWRERVRDCVGERHRRKCFEIVPMDCFVTRND